jgi:hypothetical protein
VAAVPEAPHPGPVLTPAATGVPAPSAPPEQAAPAVTVPTTPPPDVTWQVWRTLALPVSRTAGPREISGDAASGFARTPTGALLAAVQAASRKVAAGEPGWRQVADAMIAPGPGRDAWIAARGRVRHHDEPVPGTFAQVAGFQFVSYTPTDAVVQLASRNADGSFGVVALHVAWLDGDWRLVLAPDGGDATSKQRAASLAGFVPWGGV